MATAKKTAVKKRVAKAKPVKKIVKKTSPKKQQELKQGSGYACGVCGLAITVDEVCGCVDYCDIICCGEQMKPAK
jgi:rubrerythrin